MRPTMATSKFLITVHANLASAVFVPIAIGLAFAVTTFSKKYLHKKLEGEHPVAKTEKPEP